MKHSNSSYNPALDLNNDTEYLAWRDKKLTFRQQLNAIHCDTPCSNWQNNPRFTRAILTSMSCTNTALIRCHDIANQTQLINLGHSLGLATADNNIRANARSVSSIEVRPQSGNQYIPYSNKQLSWHTDGYYNDSTEQIHAWILYCVRPALDGGINELVDHEMAYIRLRDENPDYIQALSSNDVLTIPENRENGKLLRPTSTGPVFSIAPR